MKNKKEITQNQLLLIPKTERYIQYMLELILKLPRVEKFNIGNEYKNSMYQMLENILYLSKIEDNKCLEILNKIDAKLNCQRIFLRIMKANRWIDEHKFNVAMEKILELGKILGGLIKYYAQNNKKSIW